MKPKLTYANVVATLALFLALGGVGYAATKLPRHSVGRAQLKSGAVNSRKVKNNSLTGADVKTGSLTDCQAGMKLVAGTCFQTASRPATIYSAALLECAEEGLRLPTQGELVAYDVLEYARNETSAFEWVEPSTSNGSSERANLLRAIGGGYEQDSDSVEAEYAYRCVVGPSY